MKINSNFKRVIIYFLCCLLQSLFFGIIFIIFKLYYNIPILLIILFATLSYLGFEVEPSTFSTKIFNKYCNKQCHNCSMWSCDFHYKDGKYIK